MLILNNALVVMNLKFGSLVIYCFQDCGEVANT